MKKVLSLLLVLVLCLSLLPVSAFADDPAPADETDPGHPGRIEQNGMVLDKFYDETDEGGLLTLEAYAKGEVTVTSTEVAVPVDIVFVLDVSGSMSDRIVAHKGSDLDTSKPDSYYYDEDGHQLRYRDGSWQHYNWVWSWSGSGYKWENVTIGSNEDISITRLNCLKEAATSFVSTVAANAADTGADNRIAIVTFAYSASTVSELTSVSTGSSNLKTNINGLSAGGATRSDLGLAEAKDIIDEIPESRESNKVVVLITDGTPTNNSSFEADVANAAISTSKEMKDDGVKVYSIGLFSTDPASNGDDYKYLNGVSSNFPDATAYTDLGTRASSKYYANAKDGGALNDIFETIANESASGSTTVQLDAEAKTVDVISPYFELTLPDGTDVKASDIKVYTAKYDANNDTFGDPVPAASSPAIDKKNYSINVSSADKSVTVTGFDYGAHYCAPKPANAPENYEESGFKLIIQIPITPNPESAGKKLPTNAPTSGIKDKGGNEVAYFPVPQADIAKTFTLVHIDVDNGTNETERARETITLDTEVFNATTRLPAGKLYGGLYVRENDEKIYSDDLCGMGFVPVDGGVYYMREVDINFIRPRLITVYKQFAPYALTHLYLASAVDSIDDYKTSGFILNGTDIPGVVENGVYKSILIDYATKADTYYTVNDSSERADGNTNKALYSGMLTDGNLFAACVDQFVGESKSFSFTPYYVTGDNVKVTVSTLSVNTNGGNGKGDGKITGDSSKPVVSMTNLNAPAAEGGEPATASVVGFNLLSVCAFAEEPEVEVEEPEEAEEPEEVEETEEPAEEPVEVPEEVEEPAEDPEEVEEPVEVPEEVEEPAEESEEVDVVMVECVEASAAGVQKKNGTEVNALVTLDSAEVLEVGFKYKVRNTEKEVKAELNADYSGYTFTAKWNLSGINAISDVTITPYWVLTDGTVVEGEAVTYSYITLIANALQGIFSL